MGSGTKGQSSSTTTQTPAAMGEYEMLMSRLNRVGSQGYTPYGGELVAPTNQNQLDAWRQFASAYGSAQPDLAEAEKYARLGASPIQASAIENYSNPYQDMVTKATMNQLQNVQQANNTQATGSTLNSGGLFNDRAGVMQGQLANQESLANAQTLGGLNSANYAQALAAAQGDRSAAAQAAYTFGNLGQEQLQTLLQGAQGTLTAGQLEQQQRQALDTSNYNQWQIAQAFPYQQMSWMAGLGTGIGSQMGGTSSTTSTPAQPNPWNQALGLGMFGLGMFAKDGGRIPEPEGFADGGAPGGLSLGDTPFGGAHGFIPSAQMHMGSGAPPPPKAPTGTAPGTPKGFGDMSSSSLKSAGKGAGNLYDKMFPQAQDNPIPAGFGTTTGLNYDSQGNSIPTLDAGIMGPDMPFARRGGAIHGYAGGGAPDDDADTELQGGLSLDAGAFNPGPNMGEFAFPGMNRTNKGDRAEPTPMPSFDLAVADAKRGKRSRDVTLGEGFPDSYTDDDPIPLPPSRPGRGDLETAAPGLPPAREVSDEPVAIADASYEPTGSVGRGRSLGDVRLPEEREERSNAMRNALMTAGMGLMASRSPWLGSAIGEAGMAGLSAYSGTQKTEHDQKRQEKLDQEKIRDRLEKINEADRKYDLEVQKLKETESYHKQQTEQGKIPSGYRATPEGMTYIKGGPHDPAVIQATEDAKASAKNGPGMSPEAKEVMARSMIAGNYQGYNSLGRTAQGLKVRDELNNTATEIVMRERGLNPQQAADYLNKQKQEFAAHQIGINTEARTTGQREANLNLILKVADAAVPAALELNKEATRIGGFTPLNRLIQKGEVMTSDPIQARFAVANLQLAESWARAMNPTGVMRDADRDLALRHLDTALSAGTYEAVVKQIQTQIQRDRDSIRGVDPRTPLDLNRPMPAIGVTTPAAPAGGAANPPPATAAPPPPPPRPPGIPPGAGWSPSQQKWFTRDGHVYDAKGVAVQ